MVSKVTAWGMEEAIEENLKEIQDRQRQIVDKGMEEDNTEKMLLQQLLMSNSITLEQLGRLETLLAEVGSLAAWKTQIDEERERLEQESLKSVSEDRFKNNDFGSLF
jgi:hypothetical protein